ncbi:MAG: GNAT family N-acetyltransferase [Microbacterium enclense]
MTNTTTELSLRLFARQDWAWVQAWFGDETLSATLGPLEEEWLHAAVSGIDGPQLVVHDHNGPVGLVGVVWDPDGRRHVVTDLAVDPRRRRTGLGHRVLTAALSWSGHPPARGWAAFVDVDNRPAKAFFQSAGWRNNGLDDGMNRYTRPCATNTSPHSKRRNTHTGSPAPDEAESSELRGRPRRKISPEQMAHIRELIRKQGRTAREVAAQYGVTEKTIHRRMRQGD